MKHTKKNKIQTEHIGKIFGLNDTFEQFTYINEKLWYR